MKKSDVEKYVEKKIDNIKKGNNKAFLPRLRREVGKEPGNDPILWGLIFNSAVQRVPFEFEYERPSKFEWAVHTALTLYAWHATKMGEEAHKQGVGFGYAVSRLAEDEEDRQRIWTRFAHRTTYTEIRAIAVQIRQLVGRLRDEGIGMDYAKLAGQLYVWQFEDGPSKVRLAWASEFFRIENKEKAS